MKIIRFGELDKKERPDGRTVSKVLTESLDRPLENIQILYVTHPPNLVEDQHCHRRSYECLLFLDPARYLINGQVYDINREDFVLFEPGDVHGAISINNEVRIWVFQVPAIVDDKEIIKK